MREKIRKVAEQVNRENNSYKEGQCRKLSGKLCQALEEENINAGVKEGKIQGLWGTARHFFVLAEEEYIVDISLCQFTEENANKYNWDTYINREDIPEVVVTKKGEEWFDYYIL